MSILSDEIKKVILEQVKNNEEKDTQEQNPPSEEKIDDNPPPENPDTGVPQEENTGEEGEAGEDGAMPDEGISVDTGKMYELRRIHYRLVTIRNHLEIFVEEEFDEIKKSISKAIELFELVINNFDKYADKIDDIIIKYYQYLKDTYEIIQKKYKKFNKKND